MTKVYWFCIMSILLSACPSILSVYPSLLPSVYSSVSFSIRPSISQIIYESKHFKFRAYTRWYSRLINCEDFSDMSTRLRGNTIFYSYTELNDSVTVHLLLTNLSIYVCRTLEGEYIFQGFYSQMSKIR